MTRNARIGFLAAAVVVVIVAVIAIGSGGSDKEKTTTGVTVVTVKGDKPVGGVHRIDVDKGDRVRFVVKTDDTKDEIHNHYDNQGIDIAPGQPAKFDFVAQNDGIYEVELEDAGVKIIELRVNP